MPYLSRRALEGLANYKYVASGLTWLDDIHQPAWNGVWNRESWRGDAAQREREAAGGGGGRPPARHLHAGERPGICGCLIPSPAPPRPGPWAIILCRGVGEQAEPLARARHRVACASKILRLPRRQAVSAKKKKNHPRPPRLSHSPPSPARPAHSTAAVNYLPTWLAPNLITLAGLAVLTGAYAVTAAHAPALEAAAPRWVYALMGAATFIYLHLDVLDGKQARRTGSSSPLGQLFDHGCDALAVHLLIVGIGASIDTGLTAKAVLGQLAVMAPWIAAHWEEYHSGHIRYGNGWWGVTEANYVLIALHTVTACAGPGVWRASAPGLAARVGLDPTFPALPPRLAALLSTWVGTDLLLVGIVSAGVFQVSGPLWRVLVSRRDAPLAPGLAGAKQLGRGAAARHAAHLALLLGLGAAAMMEPIRAGRADWHVRVVFGSFGIVYALEVSGRWRARGGEGDEREREREREREGEPAPTTRLEREREKKTHERPPLTLPLPCFRPPS